MVDWESGYIYESPDGVHVFRRPAGGVEYTPDMKEEIDMKTGQPTGRKFSEYPFKTKEDLNMERSLSEERYLEFWTCDICNEHTHEVDYDYLGNGTNHLRCELELENERTESK